MVQWTRSAYFTVIIKSHWGQSGPLAKTPERDSNYIALAGALDSFCRAGERPVAPLALVGDYGGGYSQAKGQFRDNQLAVDANSLIAGYGRNLLWSQYSKEV